MRSQKTTPRMPRVERRAQLLSAARDVIGSRGYHAAAMDDIADRAGVSKPVLYSYFSGKHSLYLALLDRCAADVMEAVESSLASSQDNRVRGFAVLEAFFQLLQDDDASFRLIFQSDVSDDEVRDRVEAVEQWSSELIAGLIREQSGLSEQEALMLATGLAGMTHAAARYWIQNPGRASRERTTQLLAQVVWMGISGLTRDSAAQDPAQDPAPGPAPDPIPGPRGP